MDSKERKKIELDELFEHAKQRLKNKGEEEAVFIIEQSGKQPQVIVCGIMNQEVKPYLLNMIKEEVSHSGMKRYFGVLPSKVTKVSGGEKTIQSGLVVCEFSTQGTKIKIAFYELDDEGCATITGEEDCTNQQKNAQMYSAFNIWVQEEYTLD